MSSREKKIAIALGILGSILVIWRFGLPLANERLFVIKQENNELRRELERLDAELLDVEPSRRLYQEYVERTGFTNATDFKNPFYNRLNELANQAHFGNLRMQPSGITDHKRAGSRKKSGIKELRFTINADGTLESIAGFLKAFYELPYIARVTSLKLDAPSGRARRKQGVVHMRASIEALVPPDHPVGRVNLALSGQPPAKVKHKERDYALIWERDPFKEYQAPPPRISEPIVETTPKTPVKPPPLQIGDPNAAHKVIRMALIYGSEDFRVDELLIVNTRDLSWEYVGLGEKLDGGVVRLVHPWGAVTRREDGQERMYPVGKTLAESMLYEKSTGAYPEIAFAYQELRSKETGEEKPDLTNAAGKDAGQAPASGESTEPGTDESKEGSNADKEERKDSAAGEDDNEQPEPEKEDDQ